MSLSTKDKVRLYTEFANYIRAGFGIDQALRSLVDQSPAPARREFLENVRRSIRQGSTFSQAIESANGGVSSMELAVIRPAELAGMLDQAFDYLAEHFRALSKTRRDIKVSLIYPALLVHMAILLPTIPRYLMSQDFPREVSVTVVQLLIAYGIAAFLTFGLTGLVKLARTRTGADRCVRLLPLIGAARKSMALQRFCSVFQMSIECGQKISAGAAAGGQASESAIVHTAANQLANTARGGSPIGSEILALESAFPRELGTSIVQAEQTGLLSEELARWANLYRQRVDDQLRLIAFWTPKILFFFVAIFVAWQIIGMFLGTYMKIFEKFDKFG